MTDVRTCRVCGCTDTNACVDPVTGPCSWATLDICSSCVPAGAAAHSVATHLGPRRLLGPGAFRDKVDAELELYLRPTKYAVPDWRSPEARQFGEALVASGIHERLAEVTARRAQELDRVVLAQLDAIATEPPVTRDADVVEDVKRALRTIEDAKRTVLVHPSIERTVREGLAGVPLVRVMASELVDAGTAYVLNPAAMAIDYTTGRITNTEGDPVDPRHIVRITDTV